MAKTNQSIRWNQLDEREWKKEKKTDHLYTIILKIYYVLYTIKLKICTQRFYYASSKFSKFIQGTVSFLFFSSWPLSLC
jgi:hypothetical protein